MNTVTLNPSTLNGSVSALPSKSEAHRALIASSLSSSPTALHGLPAPYSRDMEATMAVLRSVFSCRFASDGDTLSVTPCGAIPPSVNDGAVADCGESGTTLRLLLPVAAALTGARTRIHFTGQGRLPQRPLGELVAVLAEHGTTFSAQSLPFAVGGKLEAGEYCIPGNVSSQYISGLLFALPLLEGSSRIDLTTAMESAGYIQMTLQTLRAWGVAVESSGCGWLIPGRQPYNSPGDFTIGGDWSNAALWLAAGAVNGTVTVRGLNENSTQGDRRIAGILSDFGAKITAAGSEFSVTAGSRRPLKIDMREIPDLLPVLAVLSTSATGPSHFYNAGRLRLKESDRLAATAALIRDLGGECEEQPEALTVQNRPLWGGAVHTCNDHRLAMAAALAATLCSEPVMLDDADCCRKSYPGLWKDYQHLGGNIA